MKTEQLIEAIEARQLPGGGWGYTAAAPCTEPTAWAVLALRAAGATRRLGDAQRWLKSQQVSDGGWRPRPEVDLSTWVTSLALMVFPGETRARDWLLAQTGRDARLTQRVREWMLGVKREYEAETAWSWFPETSAWVAPTAYAMLALRGSSGAGSAERVTSGERFLLVRRCADGGWNHGSSHALGYDAASYPETTGLALLAMAGGGKVPASAKACALKHLETCRTAEGVAWLRLGLTAVGETVPAKEAPVARSVQELALSLLAELALAGRHPLMPARAGAKA